MAQNVPEKFRENKNVPLTPAVIHELKSAKAKSTN